jgi:hypothetical protein
VATANWLKPPPSDAWEFQGKLRIFPLTFSAEAPTSARIYFGTGILTAVLEADPTIIFLGDPSDWRYITHTTNNFAARRAF